MDEIEIRPQEASEARETSEQAEIRALDDATFSPGDSLEQVGDFRQAEAIQTSLETVMASIATEMSAEAVSVLPIPRPEDEISAKGTVKGSDGTAEMPLPGTAGEHVGIDPIPMPHTGDEIVAKGTVKGTDGTVEMPLPATAGEQVGFDPVPLPRTGDEIGAKGTVKGTDGTVEMPLSATAREQVGFDPVPLPRTVDEIGAKGTVKGTDGTAEMPLPGTAGEAGYKFGEAGLPGEEVSATPITLPHEANLASSAGRVAGSGAEGVGITPINLPREADLASSAGGVAGSGAEGVGITPINLPREANVVSDAIEGVMGGSEVAAGGLKGPGGDGVASGAVKGPGGDGVASGAIKGPGGDGVASAPVPQPVPYVAERSVEGLSSVPAEEVGFTFDNKEPGGSVEIPLPGVVGEIKELDNETKDWEEQLNTIGDDAQLADIDLQNVLEKQQQIVEMLSRMSQTMSDTAQGIIRNMKA
jgi:hypothetical protein